MNASFTRLILELLHSHGRVTLRQNVAIGHLLSFRYRCCRLRPSCSSSTTSPPTNRVKLPSAAGSRSNEDKLGPINPADTTSHNMPSLCFVTNKSYANNEIGQCAQPIRTREKLAGTIRRRQSSSSRRPLPRTSPSSPLLATASTERGEWWWRPRRKGFE